MKLVQQCLIGVFLVNAVVSAVEIQIGSQNTKRESRKLFGGYRITPRFCKPSRKSTLQHDGPSICMFNHECLQRNGQVVGACMDGFLFGACCQLPADQTGELIESDLVPVTAINGNNLGTTPTVPSDIMMSSGVSQITQSLLNQMIPTAQEDAVVQLGGETFFTTAGVTHTKPPETHLVTNMNTITAADFQQSSAEDRKTTVTFEDTTVPYSEQPLVHITVSGGNFVRPMFRPKPIRPVGAANDENKYVLVPTITKTPNKTQEVDTVVNILQLLNQTSSTTSRRPPSTSYVYSATSTSTRPDLTTTKKPPSTSYVFSTTLKPRKTTPVTTTTTKKKKPTKSGTRRPATTTLRPQGHSTVANSPAAFLTTKRPPSTSYVYSSTPTRRPPQTINTHIAGPGFAVTSSPGQYSPYPSPAPTLIVLSPVPEEDEVITSSPIEVASIETRPPVFASSPRPPNYSGTPQRKPSVNSVTINNHVTQNIYSTSERPSPQPTVLITPKPSISSSLSPLDYNPDTVEVGTSGDELINFPPVRNPNLNMSNPVLNEDDITTPGFVEDDALNQNVESFVNKIIQALQEPFEGLKDVVFNRTTPDAVISSTTKKPVKKTGTTTKKPPRTPSSSSNRPTSSRPVTTRKPTTSKRPTSTTTKTTTKRPKTTRKPVTTTTPLTTISYLEEADNTLSDEGDFRNECGVRPLLRTGRIVGGKGATFGEFPWQVLVRESTWLGLFTKNKCGGVLISSKYVMTAAHCQPGFLASLVAVFGEFDISGDLESRRHVSRNVRRVIVHRKYDAATFENDLALLELESPVKLDAHIIPICLPREGEDFTGRMATVTGWGRLKYGGGVPSVLQEVQVPIMENHVCQEMFRTAGHSKVILESFLCAGYANGQKDSCEGDSGGPLVLQRPDGRFQLAGTVSHGIKCAAPYLPGVYMRTAFYKPWITAITGVDSI